MKDPLYKQNETLLHRKMGEVKILNVLRAYQGETVIYGYRISYSKGIVEVSERLLSQGIVNE